MPEFVSRSQRLKSLYDREKGRIIFFKPFIESDNEWNDSEAIAPYIEEMGKGLRVLIQLPFDIFLAALGYDQSVSEFFESYCLFREREHDANSSSGATSLALDALDRLVFLCIYRLVSYEELNTLDSMAISSDPLESYADLVRNESGLTSYLLLPRVMDMCSILSLRNGNLAKRLVIHISRIRPELLENELVSLASEVWSVVDQLASTKTAKVQHSNILVYIIDLLASLAAYLRASLPLLVSSAILADDGSIIPPPGQQLIFALQLMYEVVLPIFGSDGDLNESRRQGQLLCIDCLRSIIGSTFGFFGENEDMMVQNMAEEVRTLAVGSASISARIGVKEKSKSSSEKKKEIFPFDLSPKSWPEMLVVLTNAEGGHNGDAEVYKVAGRLTYDYQGYYLSDAFRSLEDLLLRRLEVDGLDIEYFTSLMNSKVGFLNQETVKNINMENGGVAGYVGLKLSFQEEQYLQDKTCGVISKSGSNAIDEVVASVQSIFPDYGEAFVKACTVYFDGETERVVDALLSNNLPPVLANLDRRTKVITSGKAGLVGTGQVVGQQRVKGRMNGSGKKQELVYRVVHDASYIRQEQARAAIIEEQRERDSEILQQEYSDDYDDQYDGVVGTSGSASSVGEDWRRRMDNMRRFNALLKHELNEQATWDAMRNTNHDLPYTKKGKNKRDNDDDNDDDDDNDLTKAPQVSQKVISKEVGVKSSTSGRDLGSAPSFQSRQGRGPSRDNKGGGRHRGGRGSVRAGNNGSDGDGGISTRKPRTKTFDKHHAKDRASRKYGRGM
jgi:hypothetical protein